MRDRAWRNFSLDRWQGAVFLYRTERNAYGLV